MVSRHVGSRRTLSHGRRGDPRPPDVRASPPVVGAVLAAPDGIRAATQRTQQADAALTLVDPELKSFRVLHGLPATVSLSAKCVSWQGRERECGPPPILVSRVFERETDASISWIRAAASQHEGLRRGLSTGANHGGHRPRHRSREHSLLSSASHPHSARSRTPSDGDSVSFSNQPGNPHGPAGRARSPAPLRSRRPACARRSWHSPSLGDTLVGLTRDQMLWRDPRTSPWSLGPMFGCARWVADLYARRSRLLGRRRTGRGVRAPEYSHR